MSKINIHWLRRDLRLHDNTALHYAINNPLSVQPIFIFDKNILDKLEDADDARITYLHDRLTQLKSTLEQIGSTLRVYYGYPKEVFEQLTEEFDIAEVYTNRDYEPYALDRDKEIEQQLSSKGIKLYTFKDHVIYEKEEILSDSGNCYKVYTPYSKKWKAKYFANVVEALPNYSESTKWHKVKATPMISLEEMGFIKSTINIPGSEADTTIIQRYTEKRNFPAIKGTTRLGIHLRFGTVGIREMVALAAQTNETWLNELIWREFYIQVLANFPHVVDQAFKKEYDAIPWRNDEEHFALWCEGKTGYPIVDAGMRELNATGFMHNRVRMITASFLTKHLLLDWRWGEAYFARKLLDFELASNNGGWQWAAGTGTDAQPYFRVFNPQSQTEKFDKELQYIKKWVPEYGTQSYPSPIVDHKFARLRAIETYKTALGK
jgi:deoxyribodipyrimidine photo-lyase